jgi:hypothetical protein
MAVSVTVKIERKGDDLEKRIKEIRAALAKGPLLVKVGFPAGKVPSDLISIAFWNHEGTSRGIPPRPFITEAMFTGKTRIRTQLRTTVKGILAGKGDLKGGLMRVAMLGQDLIQVQIGSNMPPPNAPSTVAAKGSSRTLVDTGRMMASVTWDWDK